MNGVAIASNREALSCYNYGSFLLLNPEFACNLDVVPAPHSANQSTKIWAWTDDTMPVRARMPLIGAEVPDTGYVARVRIALEAAVIRPDSGVSESRARKPLIVTVFSKTCMSHLP
jgi:hypothetical protein